MDTSLPCQYFCIKVIVISQVRGMYGTKAQGQLHLRAEGDKCHVSRVHVLLLVYIYIVGVNTRKCRVGNTIHGTACNLVSYTAPIRKEKGYGNTTYDMYQVKECGGTNQLDHFIYKYKNNC